MQIRTSFFARELSARRKQPLYPCEQGAVIQPAASSTRWHGHPRCITCSLPPSSPWQCEKNSGYMIGSNSGMGNCRLACKVCIYASTLPWRGYAR